MDFNPLDLLAAAALCDKKESPSENKEASAHKDSSVSDQESNSEDKDADDNHSEDMGKTKSSCLNPPIKINSITVSCEMSPQKISWSPESFLSCLEKPSFEHEKLIIEELSPTYLKEKSKCKTAPEIKDEVKIEKENLDYQLDSTTKEDKVSLENIKNEKISSLLPAPSDENQSLDIKEVKKEEDASQEQESHPEGFDTAQDVKLDSVESGGQSDTDTADTSDSKAAVDELPEMSSQDIVSLDHSYCHDPGRLCQMSSMDMYDEDIDVCSDSSPLTEDSEQRSRNFSLDCNYLKTGIMEGKSVTPPQLHQYTDQSKFVSPSKLSSNSESLLRLSKGSDNSAFKQVSVLSPERPGPSCAKFKIGTFASFSSSNMELEKYLRGLDPAVDKKADVSSLDNDRSNKIIHSPIYSPSVQPLLQSPTLDWDRSEAGSETQDDSSDARTPHRLSPDVTFERVNEWSHPMYHDHDYCAKSQLKPVAEDVVKLPLSKRKYTKRKSKLESVNHEKIMKAKYLKKELLKDSFLKSTPNLSQEQPQSVADAMKTNPVGRPRKRPLEKAYEEEIDPETGAKMKITGKFQDQYVYYLSKSKTTSRRRQTSLPILADKIIVPAPKPGDIIVPHLTDADIEVVRKKGRSALNLPERPHMPHISSLSPKSLIPPSLPTSQSNDLISDVDSHIVSTILSMENDNLASPSSSQSQDLSQNSDLYSGHPSISDSDPNMMSEQVLNYLLSDVKEEPSLLQSSASLFPSLPADALYSKAGHLSDPELGGHTPCGMSNKLSGHTSSEILSAHSPLVNHSFEHSVIKSEPEDCGSLPDDLSSFISHSQVTTSSNTTHDGDSQSSAKSESSSDLSPFGTPNLPSSAPRLTSIEKTLDYLGVKDGELKLEQSDLFTPKMNSEEISSQLTAHNSIVPADDTPWIVTVTLYFNDVPAIMMVNEPYIRLVDIHKQILPAKDTGILKKRCQLLNIPVLNCTEMHRYFLVQYGKAYNSKSTLIISKDQATALVGYYATPQPRLGRAEEAGVRRYSCSDGGSMSPVPVDNTLSSSCPAKKRGCNRNGKKVSSGISSPDVVAAEMKALAEDEAALNNNNNNGLNKRTRHKKVNYLEMLRGEEKEKPTDSVMETIESVLKTSSDLPLSNSKLSKDKYSSATNNKSLSKKKVNRSQSCDKKNKDHSNHRRKSGEGKKRVKNDGKLSKSSKTKGSISKLNKKQEKVVKKDESCVDVDMECLDSLNKSSKFKPLKLKVNSLLNFTSQRRQSSSSSLLSSSSPSKKGLFSRSNSSTSSTPMERPMRVLAVAHQAALSIEEGDSHLPSQPADIHLDLFTKSSSACVRCDTCSQFLSVPHFMKHHHVPMDNEWLATEAAHRILVPRNKENISDEERRLWEEFHRLQEAIGGFGEGDDSDSDGDVDEDTDFEGHGGQSSLETSGASYLSMDASHDSLDLSYHNPHHLPQHEHHIHTPVVTSSANKVSLHSKSVAHVTSQIISGDSQNNNRKSEQFSKNSLDALRSGQISNLLSNHQDSAASHVRTSQRRRKSKQLFSIENYCTPNKRGSEEEGNLSLSSISGCGGI